MSVTVPGCSTVRLHRLTMVAEGGDVMVGRPDIGSYALFPEEGAQVLRMLDDGSSVSEAADWYQQVGGETLDVEDFLDVLTDLRFVLAEGEERALVQPVGWQRLGRAVFSWPAWLAYGVCFIAAIIAMVHQPELRPSYRALFFTDRISLISVMLLVLGVPCILIHESFHALAGRRLRLPSTLGIGRRLYFLVAETRLDSLLSVPRRKRYLPFLAGMLADLLMMSVLTLLAVALRAVGSPHWCWALCVAVSFGCVLRLVWQFQFYLETDLYYVASTALRCTDLQNACRYQIRSWMRQLLRRSPLPEIDDWSDHDRQVARWYAPVLIAGYGFALGSLALVGVPATVRFWSTVFDRLTQPGVDTAEIIDALIFLALTGIQLGLLLYVSVRDWRRRLRATRQTSSKEN
jgi:hypothetical protein